MILVLGATGTIGSQVTRQLVAAGHKPRVLVRSPDKLKDLKDKVEVHTGDLNDAAAVNKALQGADKVFIVTAGLEGAALESKAIDLAKAAGVKHVVKLSVLGAEYEAITFGKWHRANEKKLEASGMAWTFLRCGNFMSNAFNWVGSMKAQGKVFAPLGDSKVAPIDPADIGAVAVLALTKPGHESKAYTLTGGAALSTAEQVAIIAKAAGIKAEFVDIPPEAARDGMLKMGMPEAYVSALIELYALMKAGQASAVSPDVEKLLGRKPGTLETWANANAAAFR